MSRPNQHAKPPASLLQRTAAGLLVALVWLLGMLEYAPAAHGWLHSDADQSDHSCAITMFAQGIEPASNLALAREPALLRAEVPALPSAPQVTRPRFTLPPSLAPPAC